MSATNSTVNYHFPIFIGTDIPSWLVDWNNAMTDIDSAIAAALLAGNTAEADVTALESTVQAIQTSVTTLTNSVNDNVIERAIIPKYASVLPPPVGNHTKSTNSFRFFHPLSLGF